MPRLNLFLNADVVLYTDQILFNQSLLAPEPKLGTKAQRKALHCILRNVGRYRSQPLLYSIRNQANPPEQYNPHGYGQGPKRICSLRAFEVVCNQTQGEQHYCHKKSRR